MPEPARADFVMRTSPLHAFAEAMRAASASGQSGATLRELPFLAQVNVRGDAKNPDFSAAVRGAAGLDLPIIPNTVTTASWGSALWLGPDEWLLVGEPGSDESLVVRLKQALAGLHTSVVDVGADRTVIEVSGARSRHLLSKGCSIDLHPRAFEPGRCVQTNFSRTGVILQQMDATPTWRLFVRSSFASYLASWLIDAIEGLGMMKD